MMMQEFNLAPIKNLKKSIEGQHLKTSIYLKCKVSLYSNKSLLKYISQLIKELKFSVFFLHLVAYECVVKSNIILGLFSK